MREIKFRAINSLGKLIYGLPYTDGTNETAYYKEYNNRLCWRNENGASCNQPYRNGTLMQYTGLKDAINKNEVFEHDIINLLGVGFLKVEWDYRDTGWICLDKHFKKTDLSDILLKGGIIVGNIHENKELLNG